jgi:hypothetical protein
MNFEIAVLSSRHLLTLIVGPGTGRLALSSEILHRQHPQQEHARGLRALA